MSFSVVGAGPLTLYKRSDRSSWVIYSDEETVGVWV